MLNKLLIIDDDEITVLLCKSLIQFASFSIDVFSFTNGKEGIDYFSNYFERKKNKEDVELAPELILLDLDMPIMNGWKFLDDFTRKYSERLPDTKVVILTSSINPEDYLKSRQYDIVIDFVHKPLEAESLEDLKKHEELIKYFN